MRSLIIIEVEHGEDTDELSIILETLADETGHGVPGAENVIVTNATVRVDLPDCFVLDS